MAKGKKGRRGKKKTALQKLRKSIFGGNTKKTLKRLAQKTYKKNKAGKAENFLKRKFIRGSTKLLKKSSKI